MLGVDTQNLDAFALLDELQDITGTAAPSGLSSLRSKEVRHKTVCAKEEMKKFVAAFAKQ